MEILGKSIYKSKDCIQSPGKCFTHQFPVCGFNETIQECCNALGDLITGLLDLVPRNTFQGFVQFLSNHGADFCEISIFPGVFEKLGKIFELAVDRCGLKHIFGTETCTAAGARASTVVWIIIQLVDLVKSQKCPLVLLCGL